MAAVDNDADKKNETITKSSVLGASSNLVNAIVGAGIVGIPFALKETGCICGILLVVLVAALASKSLRMLIETASLVNTTTYESLTQACFGTAGHLYISVNMFSLAYGSMVTYLMIVKDTLPRLILFEAGELAEDVFQQQSRTLLILISATVILPLSCQENMSDLSKTSRINVVFDLLMVCCVVWMAPIDKNVQEAGGIYYLLANSTLHPNTLFVGMGVLSFAFVCQHSAFIISGSLQHSREWPKVTRISLSLCGGLAILCGVGGYLGYLEQTQGNILNNLNSSGKLPNVARGLLGTTMLFVYPMESFVARHVCVVMIKRYCNNANAVATAKRRILLTSVLYIMALIPALLFDDLGKVLAVTGTIGGSSLSYMAPGAIYLAIHGERFLESVVKRYWNYTRYSSYSLAVHQDGSAVDDDDDLSNADFHGNKESCWRSMHLILWKAVSWYLLGMPIWCRIATIGRNNVAKTQKLQQEEVGMISMVTINRNSTISEENDTGEAYDEDVSLLTGDGDDDQFEEDIIQDKIVDRLPTVWDFIIAVGYILFGTVALSAGVISIVLEKSGPAL